MKMFTADQMTKRYNKAVSVRRPWLPLWQDVYDLCLPGRRGFFGANEGESKTDDIYDDTGAQSLQEFANVMVDGIVSSDIFKLMAGSAVDPEEKDDVQNQLDEVTDFLHEILRKSNFHEQFFENMLDIGIGTAAMNAEPSGDARYINWESWPLESYVIDRGPFGQHDGSFRMRNDVRASEVQIAWPRAKIPDELKKLAVQNPDIKPTFIEFSVRLWSEPEEAYQSGILWLEKSAFILSDLSRGQGSRGSVIYNWARASGETWGRGPALLALPSMRTTNFTVELILENADMHVGGIWKAENDGVTNYDNIRLTPGTVVTYMPGQRGLEALQPPGSFNVADIILSDQRKNIREALLAEDFSGRGDTPISSNEVSERRIRVSRKAGASVGRIFNEGITKFVHRMIYLLKQQGILEMPMIDGSEIDIIAVSPLARAQKQESIQQKLGFAQSVTGLMGDSAQMWLNPEPMLKDLARLFEQPQEYLTTQEQRDEIAKNAATAQQLLQEQQQGQPPVA